MLFRTERKQCIWIQILVGFTTYDILKAEMSMAMMIVIKIRKKNGKAKMITLFIKNEKKPMPALGKFV